MNLSWREAIERVLREEGEAMHYSEISEQVLAKGYYKTDGATPAATVNAHITGSIKHDGAKSPFVRVGRGTFALRHGPVAQPGVTPSQKIKAGSLLQAQAEQTGGADADDDGTGIVRCLGMYWQRDLVVWRAEPKLFGRQQALAKAVDFSKQRGIYILYDHHTVVYVGRSIDRPLGKRLYEHTIDRLGSRWNRFSWFGLLDVANDGELLDKPLRPTVATLISTFESLLIETLEPPQNRKRGDDFSVMEYLQDVDPELRERELQNTLRAIELKLRGQV
jgi:HB1, ASXL, restriction endonuclease HTH domain